LNDLFVVSYLWTSLFYFISAVTDQEKYDECYHIYFYIFHIIIFFI